MQITNQLLNTALSLGLLAYKKTKTKTKTTRQIHVCVSVSVFFFVSFCAFIFLFCISSLVRPWFVDFVKITCKLDCRVYFSFFGVYFFLALTKQRL